MAYWAWPCVHRIASRFPEKTKENRPDLAEINIATYLRNTKKAKFPLLINDICGKLGSGIALALSLEGRGVRGGEFATRLVRHLQQAS